MQSFRSTQRICHDCSAQICILFKDGRCSTPNVPSFGRKATNHRFHGRFQTRQLRTRRTLRPSTKAVDAKPEAIKNPKKVPRDETEADFKARMMLYRDMIASGQATTVETQAPGTSAVEEDEGSDLLDIIQDGRNRGQDENQNRDGIDDSASVYERTVSIRTHPSTAAGKFSMSHTTLQLPRDTVVHPINALLSKVSNKQLSEVAQKKFGGPFLPNSTATPSKKGHMRQQPMALEASQGMGELEADCYLAAMTPGIYVTVMSCLVEIRKRLGPEWIKGLLSKDGGPRILDSGGAGAGVLAWRDLLSTEWKLLHPDGVPNDKPVPAGKSTVVVGSPPLRTRMSRLLDNTTFLPRLPDRSRDEPSAEETTAVPMKTYDIIVAPHTLWTLGADYKQKNRVQNLWSMLDPNGGVLLIIEKGVPRGFELIGAAREVLLKHHIASPGSETVENRVEEPFRAGSRDKETGMIIAPCTNHLKCPLYLTPGKSTGRKDYCHFSQRYIRPQFLQRLLGVSDRNHEDIRYAYVAVQRGKDLRQDLGILQGKAAKDAAFQGYEDDESSPDESSDDSPRAAFHPLSLPRAILPPIKSHGHVIIDLCTPMGEIDRWIVPKSFSKQAYRDARKSKWGDLWALGAKTQFPRNIRPGKREAKVKHKKKYKNDDDFEEGERRHKKKYNTDDDDFEEFSKGARRHKKKNKTDDDDFEEFSKGERRTKKRRKENDLFGESDLFD